MSNEQRNAKTERDPAGTYAVRSNQANSRVETFYWDVRFTLYVAFIESPRIIKKNFLTWLFWRWDLITGKLPGIGSSCTIESCDRDAVAHLPDGNSRTEGHTVCRRHYLGVKAVIYGGIAVLGIGSFALAYWVIA